MIGRLILPLALLFAVGAKPGAIAYAQSSATAPETPWLGIAFRAGSRGVMIDEVIPDSPADVAGLLVGDAVRAVEGIETRTPNALVNAVKKHSVGQEVVVSLERHGQALQIKVELTRKLESAELLRRRLVDRPASEFSLSVLHGTAKGDLSAYKGKVVVLEFWSNWCKVCQESIEPLANLQADTIGELVVLAITSDHESQVRKYLSRASLPIPVLYDPQRHVHQKYHYDGIVPTVVVIGRDGLVRYADAGPNLNMDSVVLSAKRSVRERPL